jgi:N-acetylmuramoyl-L-alanine amidase
MKFVAKVGLDIGHGRNTFPPNKGLYKNGQAYHEHTFNANVGIKLESILKRHGIQVVMAQKPFQNDVPLNARDDFYDNQRVDLGVSIHANAGKPTASGIGVFYWHTSTKGKRLAELYMAEVEKAGLDVWGSDGIHESNPGDWDDFHMVRETDAPFILTENGFMTNTKDFQLIFKDPEYVVKIAECHAKAICKYFGITYKPEKPVAKPTQPKGDDELEAKAIVINNINDFPNAEPLANRLGCGIFTRHTAGQKQVAKQIFVVGGTKDGLKGDNFVVLSGPDRFDVSASVKNFLDSM